MSRAEIVQILQQALPDLRAAYDVKELTLFGSFARDEARADSDVDLIVELVGRPTFRGLMGLKLELEDRLHRLVDVGTLRTLKPRLRAVVEREGIHVA